MKPWKKNGKVKWESECERIPISFDVFEDMNFACVYKLEFSDGSVYVGSTKNYKKRIWVYRGNFSSMVFEVKNLALAAERSDSCRICVIEKCNECDRVTCEAKVISEFIGCENILNRGMYAENNKSIVWSKEEKKKIS